MSRILTIVAILVGTLVIVGRQLPEIASPGPIPMTSRSIASPAMQHSSPNERVSRHPRSREVTAEFQRENPCPSTGKTSGRCPGFIKDHRCALGLHAPASIDSVSNLQWQTKADAAAKDRWELDLTDPRNAACF